MHSGTFFHDRMKKRTAEKNQSVQKEIGTPSVNHAVGNDRAEQGTAYDIGTSR